MHLQSGHGGFHVKGAGFGRGELTPGGRSYAAFKVNGNFPGNPERFGLPTIQGALMLCDGETGELLAVMDSGEVTLQRTAAATAVAAQHLARPESRVVTICGCGQQASAQLRALVDVLPLRSGFAWDRDPDRVAQLLREASAMGLDLIAVERPAEGTLRSDVVVTCTTAAEPILALDDVSAGAFIAAVGADWPTKNEIAPDLMARAAVIADVLEQCLAMGDLHHAVAAGRMSAADIRGELGQVLTGARQGRITAEEITLFDSTGCAVQDVAAAAVIYERAIDAGLGTRMVLG
jgi:ornithine cyclodeaminase/alanine dehydrogenase-like protein (mu-crystallin family)